MGKRREKKLGKKLAGSRACARLRGRLRGRLWIETGRSIGLTDAGADLLDQIDAWGSLSEAARRLRFSYRRAWMLVDGMNRRWPTPLVTLSTGGRRGGGARLTDAGRQILRSYRDLQLQFEHFLGMASKSLLFTPSKSRSFRATGTRAADDDVRPRLSETRSKSLQRSPADHKRLTPRRA